MKFIDIEKVIDDGGKTTTKMSTIPVADIRDAREFYPKQKHKEDLGEDISMTRLYFYGRDGSRDGGTVDILEPRDKFAERLGSIPVTDGHH